MSNINDLRRAVRLREKAANRKVRRIEQSGVDIENTRYDPRRVSAPVESMRSRDLHTYLNQLNTFMERRTQFVPDTWGRPIPRAKWRQYKQAESKANRKADKLFGAVGSIKMPDGNTLAERDAYARNKDFPNTANHTVNSPLRKANRLPGSIASEKALIRLTKQQQAKVDKQFLDRFVKRGRKESEQMLNALGDEVTKQRLRKLTDRQFHILWAYTPFADNVSIQYENGKAQQNRATALMDENERTLANAWIDWAKKI